MEIRKANGRTTKTMIFIRGNCAEVLKRLLSLSQPHFHLRSCYHRGKEVEERKMFCLKSPGAIYIIILFLLKTFHAPALSHCSSFPKKGKREGSFIKRSLPGAHNRFPPRRVRGRERASGKWASGENKFSSYNPTHISELCDVVQLCAGAWNVVNNKSYIKMEPSRLARVLLF